MNHRETPLGAWPTARNLPTLYIPHAIAHGSRSLEDEIGISYPMSTLYHPEAVAGACWDDPVFAVRRPRDLTAIAERDRSHPDFPLS